MPGLISKPLGEPYTDSQGRPYLTVQEAKVGVYVVCDAAVTGLTPGVSYEIKADGWDGQGRLYLEDGNLRVYLDTLLPPLQRSAYLGIYLTEDPSDDIPQEQSKQPPPENFVASKVIVITGSLEEGFKFYGPFDNYVETVTFVKTDPRVVDKWETAQLCSPYDRPSVSNTVPVREANIPHILTIGVPGEDDIVRAYSSLEGAKKALADWVRANWSSAFGRIPIDNVTDAVVDRYFTSMRGIYSYRIDLLIIDKPV